MLNLTPEQQAIFDRVAGIVAKNDELRRRYKLAYDDLNKNPNGRELDYINDSDEPDAVNFRDASDAVRAEVNNVAPSLKNDDFWLLCRISSAICHNYIGA